MPDTAIQLLAVVESLGSVYKLGEVGQLLYAPLQQHRALPLAEPDEWVEVTDIELENRDVVTQVMQILGGDIDELVE